MSTTDSPETGPNGDRTGGAEPARQESLVQVTDEHGDVATAELTTSVQPHDTASVSFSSASRHVTPKARRDLVDAVLDRPEVAASDCLDAVVPMADSETIIRLQQRTQDFRARGAGSSSVIHAGVPDTDPPDRAGTES